MQVWYYKRSDNGTEILSKQNNQEGILKEEKKGHSTLKTFKINLLMCLFHHVHDLVFSLHAGYL